MKLRKIIATVMLLAVILCAVMSTPALADNEPADAAGAAVTVVDPTTQVTTYKAIASAVIIAVGACACLISMCLASRKASEGIARQPEAASPIRTALMLSLVFMETVIIYALLVVILIIFIL